MNREEAKLPIVDNSPINREIVRIVNEHIETIYDDFESRTCGNCKVVYCSVKEVLLREDLIDVEYFSCDDWERKA